MGLIERPVASVEELRAGRRALRPGEADAFFYVSDAMLTSQAALIVEIARTKRLPTMLQDQGSVAEGALASYGVSFYTAGRAARPVLLPHQPQDRENPRPHDPAGRAGAGG